MTFSVYKNFATNVKTKPPLVLFTVCLLCIIITTVCLTYYVQTQEKIVNKDAINDWLSLLQHVNEIEMCSENSDRSTGQDKLPSDGTTASISTPAKLTGLSTTTILNAQGILHLNDWYSKCPNKAFVPTYIELEFEVHNETDNQEICVTITGPAVVMPILSPEQFCKTPPHDVKKKTNWAVVSKKEAAVNEFCKSGSTFHLKFDIDYNQNLKYDSYLSKEDRIVINSHLIVTSCFLVFVVILITCYALIRKTAGATSESKQHLTKGMYL